MLGGSSKPLCTLKEVRSDEILDQLKNKYWPIHTWLGKNFQIRIFILKSLKENIKQEADQLKHAGRVVSSMQKKDHLQLWTGETNLKLRSCFYQPICIYVCWSVSHLANNLYVPMHTSDTLRTLIFNIFFFSYITR